MKTSIYTIGIGVLVLSFFMATNIKTVDACSMIDRTPQELFDKAGVVFLGKITAVATSSEGDVQNVTGDVYVDTSWKDVINVDVKIKSSGIYTCSPTFGESSRGNEYLIYAATTTEKGVYMVERMKLAKDVRQEITNLGNGYEVIAQLPTMPRFLFDRDLTLGSTHFSVVNLQTWLENNGFLKIPAGVSKGYFGQLTRSALIKYQISKGIKPSVGYFGPITRKMLNDDYWK